jgi:hypothetical protein
MKNAVIIFAMAMMLLAASSVRSDVVKDNFHLYAPTDLFENTDGILVIKLVNRSLGTPMSGMANNIHCYIKYPDGSFFVEGAHPVQEASGIYLLYFSVDDTTGIYHCWATCDYGANMTLMDAGLFTVRWDVYQNVSRLYERIGNIIYLEKWDNYNMTQQFVYALSMSDLKIQNISRNLKETDFFSNLQQIAINQAVGVLFWTLALIGLSVVSALFYTRRKSRKERLKELASTTSVPQAVVSEITGDVFRRRKR